MPPLYCYNILYHTRKPQREPLVVEAADQKYKQTNRFIYLGGVIDENTNINPEIEDESDSPGLASKSTADSSTIDQLRHCSSKFG